MATGVVDGVGVVFGGGVLEVAVLVGALDELTT